MNNDYFRRIGLYRDPTTSFAGVCSGLARYLNVDPVLVRAIAVGLTLVGGGGLLLYALGWVLMPDGRTGVSHFDEVTRGKMTSGFAGSLAVTIITLIIFINTLGFGFFVALVAGWFIWQQITTKERERSSDYSPTTAEDSPPAPTTGSSPWTSPAQPTATTVPTSAPAPATTPMPTADHSANSAWTPAASPWSTTGSAWQAADTTTATSVDDPYPPSPYVTAQPAPRRKAIPGSVTLILVAIALLLAAGSVLAHDYIADQGINVVLLTNGVIIGLFGLALVIAGMLGWRGSGLNAIALITLIVALPLAWATTLFDAPEYSNNTSFASGKHTATTVQSIGTGYSVNFGASDVDLSDMDYTEADTPIRVPVAVDAGGMTVIIPNDATAAVVADERFGDVNSKGRNASTAVQTTEFIGDVQDVNDADFIIEATLNVAQLDVVHARNASF